MVERVHTHTIPPKIDQELANEVMKKADEFNAAVKAAYEAKLRVELKLEAEYPIHRFGKESEQAPYVLRVKLFKLITTFKEL